MKFSVPTVGFPCWVPWLTVGLRYGVVVACAGSEVCCLTPSGKWINVSAKNCGTITSTWYLCQMLRGDVTYGMIEWTPHCTGYQSSPALTTKDGWTYPVTSRVRTLLPQSGVTSVDDCGFELWNAHSQLCQGLLLRGSPTTATGAAPYCEGCIGIECSGCVWRYLQEFQGLSALWLHNATTAELWTTCCPCSWAVAESTVGGYGYMALPC
eukprot:m.1342099 g.1342099  ORF g.1342099 m.1342099 type:complete len:210 (-) comp24898_c1_seq9:3771-4400(-)